MIRLAVVLAAAALACSSPAADIKLSATISVPKSTFQVRETEKLMVSFTVTNQGTTTVDPEITASTLFVNGAVPDGWEITIANGIRDPLTFRSLPPGQTMYFGYQLGRYFASPGAYTVQWAGVNFAAPPITFTILPD